ncbi:hypothetical protein MPDQ_000810 [Monascus purpureus]|uniref:5-formyltetrahydrofolate cyclo-ligase n=1 Tax=Monascus purpureus TaxID=5098 RepID=A0A507QNV1_MONPU|nr:hypothetical protein MPDQ_000810 [Monascus purpureus]BDD60404.1 hypothetical protein MAP00_005530 [Monascus purpureus]
MSKSDTRNRVWESLRKVALPDSRHHYDFSSFIADFQGSEQAISRLTALPIYQDSAILFITPDNCLEDLRLQSLRDGKTILMTTYGIRRGFWVLDPNHIPVEDYRYAATLDGMEKVAQPVALADIRSRGWKIPLMVTGTGAVNLRGVRFGKGHGFFDLEWAMLWSVGAVEQGTVVVGVVHDCQVLEEELQPEEFDTVCDVVVTPSRVVEVVGGGANKPTAGIIWPLLQPDMLGGIPPLRELKEIAVSE